MTSVDVVIVPMFPARPVRGMLTPLRAGLLRMLSGVSPCATCQTIWPLSISIAVMAPYGGLNKGRPCTVSAPLAAAAPSAAGGGAISKSATPRMKFISDLPFAGGTRPRLVTSDLPYTYKRCVCGSYDPPGQLVPPWQQPISRVPNGPPALLTTGGVKSGPILYFEISCSALAFSSGVKSITSSTENPLRP